MLLQLKIHELMLALNFAGLLKVQSNCKYPPIIRIRKLFVTALNKFSLKRAVYRIILRCKAFILLISSWNIVFSTSHKTTQHKIMTTNMRFNT